LLATGNSVAFWHEVDSPEDRALIQLPPEIPSWCAAALGTEPALRALRAWAPDVVFAHGVHDPALEYQAVGHGPAVLFAHAYHGTCVSGTKTFSFPTVTPCSRQFGTGCLLRYHVRRCGGLNPSTMLKLYNRESRRRAVMDRYRAVVTFSEHLRREFIAHGVDACNVHRLPWYVSQHPIDGKLRHPRDLRTPWKIVCIGRMETLKGGQVLLAALPVVQASLRRPLKTTFVGDGSERADWEKTAGRIMAANPDIRVSFLPWQSAASRDHLLASADLVVVPSLWPEPFGLIGLEAAALGVPAVAFANGGIAEWLEDGVTGSIAGTEAHPHQALAAAIVRCLHDPAAHAVLARNAREAVNGYSMSNHITALVRVLEDAGTVRPMG
jgi:glycosyltransferase involved in cell wall biosynthesis